MGKTRRNPNQFTTDEAQTATLMVTEGSVGCVKLNKYKYPRISIVMCDPEALEPASRVFKGKIGLRRSKEPVCPKHLVPPDGKGAYRTTKTGKPAQRLVQHLNPLLTKEFKRKWQEALEKCK